MNLEIPKINLEKYEDVFSRINLYHETGSVIKVIGLLIEGYIPGVIIGSLCRIYSVDGKDFIFAEVVGFKDKLVLLMGLQNIKGIGVGSKIELYHRRSHILVSDNYIGRVFDAYGNTIDGKGDCHAETEMPLYIDGMNPIERKLIREPLDVGIKAINVGCTFGKGQRIGIIAGSGVGKSVLMGMVARATKADVIVIALIGERGREVKEFIQEELGEEGLKKSVLVVSTSDNSPLLRIRGSFFSMCIAEYFRDKGKDVLFLMDSVTRFSMAQREIGLTIGEPPTTKGYTPSVFSLLPKLLERAGSIQNKGSITGLYTVLIEGDEIDDPIGDAVRSVVDGHIILDRSLAYKNHYPAINILASSSRCMNKIIDQEYLNLSNKLRETLATYKESEDLINIGAYVSGTNSKIDYAISKIDNINIFLKQSISETYSIEKSFLDLKEIFKD
jgi:flagellum-specific ATP synthase